MLAAATSERLNVRATSCKGWRSGLSGRLRGGQPPQGFCSTWSEKRGGNHEIRRTDLRHCSSGIGCYLSWLRRRGRYLPPTPTGGLCDFDEWVSQRGTGRHKRTDNGLDQRHQWL